MIDLQKFCSLTRDPRKNLHRPFRTPQGIAATNGHILIVIPEDGRQCDDVVPTIRDAIERYLEISKSTTSWRRLTSILLPPKLDCDECDGTGHLHVVTCNECIGGEFSHGTHTYECKECDGEAYVKVPADTKGAREKVCDACDGSGEQYVAVAVGDCHFQRKYLRMLGELPNCELAPGPSDKPAPFRFDGGQGWIMGCRD